MSHRLQPRRSPTTLLGVAAVGVALGAVLVALPDSDRRLLTFSDSHGPSAVDLLGSIILTASWLAVPFLAWRWRRRVPRRAWTAAGLLAIAGGVALYVTISRDLGWWWLPSAALLAVAQLVPVVVANLNRRDGAPR